MTIDEREELWSTVNSHIPYTCWAWAHTQPLHHHHHTNYFTLDQLDKESLDWTNKKRIMLSMRGTIEEDEPLQGIDEDNIELVGDEQALGAIEVGGDGGGGRRRRSSARNQVRQAGLSVCLSFLWHIPLMISHINRCPR